MEDAGALHIIVDEVTGMGTGDISDVFPYEGGGTQEAWDR